MTSTLLPSPPGGRSDGAIPDIAGSRYRIERSIATGGMGEVFLATDTVLGRLVAVKVLHRNLSADPGFVERFRREARAAAGLNHPNVVAVYDWGEDGRTYHMVMEYVPGASLREVLRAAGRLGSRQTAAILGQVLLALDHAHSRGIVHRDLKPENILLMPDGRAKVADFGLARAYLDRGATRTITVIGTPEYLAPEQVIGEAADPRSDLYSLGIMAFELLVGRPPFAGPSPFAVANRQVHEPVPVPSATAGTRPDLDGWVAILTQKDAACRPASAGEARRMLEAALPRTAAPTAGADASVGSLVVRVAHSSAEGTSASVRVHEPVAPANPTVTLRGQTVRIPRRRSSIGRRRRWLGATALAAAVAALVGVAGWAAWTTFGPHAVSVPGLTGAPVGRARAQLEHAGLKVHVVPGTFAPTRRGSVQSERPGPGTRLAPGSVVTLATSLGPRPVAVPSVLGLDVAAARTRLAEHHLRLGRVSYGYSAYGVDTVAWQSVPATRTAPPNSVVDVLVSRGPRPFAMPNVLGADVGDAVAALQAKGLRVETDDTTFLGLFGTTVYRESPRPGAAVVRGEVVKIYIH